MMSLFPLSLLGAEAEIEKSRAGLSKPLSERAMEAFLIFSWSNMRHFVLRVVVGEAFRLLRELQRVQNRLEHAEKSVQELRDIHLPREQARREDLSAQIKRLADFIMAEIPGEPSEDQGAVDTAIRILKRMKRVESSSGYDRLREFIHANVPGAKYLLEKSSEIDVAIELIGAAERRIREVNETATVKQRRALQERITNQRAQLRHFNRVFKSIAAIVGASPYTELSRLRAENERLAFDVKRLTNAMEENQHHQSVEQGRQ